MYRAQKNQYKIIQFNMHILAIIIYIFHPHLFLSSIISSIPPLLMSLFPASFFIACMRVLFGLPCIYVSYPLDGNFHLRRTADVSKPVLPLFCLIKYPSTTVVIQVGREIPDSLSLLFRNLISIIFIRASCLSNAYMTHRYT